MPPAILITSIGSGVGTAVLDCLDDRRQDLRILGVGCDPGAHDRERCDEFIRVPPTDNHAWSSAMSEIIRESSPLAIVAGRCDDVVALAHLASTDHLAARALLAGPAPLAADLRDTARAAELAQRLGLPFARTVLTGVWKSRVQVSRLLDASPGPWIVKPSSGSGSRGAWVTHRYDLVLRAADLLAHVVQPMLGAYPRELSRVDPLAVIDASSMHDTDVQVILGPDSRVLALGAFATTMRRGQVSEVHPHSDPATVDLAHAYGRALSRAGWRGPVNVQAAQAPDGEWLAFEMNPRFGGGSYARTLRGFDEVHLCLDAWRSCPR